MSTFNSLFLNAPSELTSLNGCGSERLHLKLPRALLLWPPWNQVHQWTCLFKEKKLNAWRILS